MYRITKRGPLYYPSHASILTANPWWKNESLARSVAAQVNDDLGIDAYGKGPVFNYSEASWAPIWRILGPKMASVTAESSHS